MRKRRPGIAGRLNQMQARVNQTLATAEREMTSTGGDARLMIAYLKAAVENTADTLQAAIEGAKDEIVDEMLDDMTFELEIAGKTLPVKMRMKPREDDDAKPEH